MVTRPFTDPPTHIVPTVVAHFDGACGPTNPGGTASGAYCIVPNAHMPGLDHKRCGARIYGQGEGWTNNCAEYLAALDALSAIWRAGHRGHVILRGDSQLVCRQYSGQYGCGSEHLRPLLARLHKAAASFASLRLEWIPREQNTEAVALSRQALTITGQRSVA